MSFLSGLDPIIQGYFIGAFGVITGSLIAAIVGLINNRITVKSEERRVIYDIASKIAMEQWKFDVESTKERNRNFEDIIDPVGMYRLDIPRAADAVKSAIDQLQAASKSKPIWTRICEWRSNKKK